MPFTHPPTCQPCLALLASESADHSGPAAIWKQPPVPPGQHRSLTESEIVSRLAKLERIPVARNYQFPPQSSTTKNKYYVAFVGEGRGVFFGWDALKKSHLYSKYKKGGFVVEAAKAGPSEWTKKEVLFCELVFHPEGRSEGST